MWRSSALLCWTVVCAPGILTDQDFSTPQAEGQINKLTQFKRQCMGAASSTFSTLSLSQLVNDHYQNCAGAE